MAVPAGAVLLVIDVQTAFDDPRMGARNNLACEANVARLLSAWREAGWPVMHVRHHSRIPTSLFHPSKPGIRVKPEARDVAGEPVIVKGVHSAFIGTDLDDRLVELDPPALLLCGMQTNYCVATTARMASNMDYVTFVVGDACAGYSVVGGGNTNVAAQLLHDVALAELQGEFGDVVSTAQAIAATKGVVAATKGVVAQ